MQKLILAVATAVALSATACVVESNDDSSLLIVNDSSYVLIDIRLAEVGDRSWGPNLLPDDLFPGDQLEIVDIDCGTYDVLVTDETGVDCVLTSLDLCFSDEVWVVDDFTLDACAFGF
jgi:hypothetical protein